MTTLTIDDVKHVAKLAKLSVLKNNYDDSLRELNAILSIVDKIQKIDTQQVEPLAHPYEAAQPLREDVVTETNQRALFQNLAPQVEQGLYLVPAVLGNE